MWRKIANLKVDGNHKWSSWYWLSNQCKLVSFCSVFYLLIKPLFVVTSFFCFFLPWRLKINDVNCVSSLDEHFVLLEQNNAKIGLNKKKKMVNRLSNNRAQKKNVNKLKQNDLGVVNKFNWMFASRLHPNTRRHCTDQRRAIRITFRVLLQ